MKSEVIISRSKNFEQKLQAIRNDGWDALHVISDFDRTLTKEFINKEEIPSLISILRTEQALSLEYAKKAHELFGKYHPIEIDPQIPTVEKKKQMETWWREHFELLIQSKLNRKDIYRATTSQKIQLRDGVEHFLKKLKNKNIPLVILSASGLGQESISYFLNQKNLLSPNIHVVGNQFLWDENGYAIKIKLPIIHTMNKEETVLEPFYFYPKIKERKNIILLGDSIGDGEMAHGFPYKNILKIGFLNKNIDQLLPEYKKHFDMIITQDGSFESVNKILEKIGT